jgi:muramoyltetrapeptide carboxypeptidase
VGFDPREATMIPAKLKAGDEVRVIAPARSLGIISQESRMIANSRFSKLGLTLSFGKHVEECDDFKSSSIAARLADIYSAFLEPKVKAILTVIGGFNSNQLLSDLDYDLIRKNPKILCGYSDISALQNAIFAKTGLVTYSGPHYSTFGMKQRFDFTLDHFVRCLFEDKPICLQASPHWSDDAWYAKQDERNFLENPGYCVINAGIAEGTILGGNLCTFNLLHGTSFMPNIRDSILFLEDDEAVAHFSPMEFDRNLQSILHQPGADTIQGLVIGRFQKKSALTNELLMQIIGSKTLLHGKPVISGVDFGHTDPLITFPIGGKVRISASAETATIEIFEH